ncbi:MAG: alpha/beta fold hydrolase [Spirochaetaceae bacterium]|nr:MAG: alpha/beta fold hydrolase [Spirochaetaceae bacterium]
MKSVAQPPETPRSTIPSTYATTICANAGDANSSATAVTRMRFISASRLPNRPDLLPKNIARPVGYAPIGPLSLPFQHAPEHGANQKPSAAGKQNVTPDFVKPASVVDDASDAVRDAAKYASAGGGHLRSADQVADRDQTAAERAARKDQVSQDQPDRGKYHSEYDDVSHDSLHSMNRRAARLREAYHTVGSWYIRAMKIAGTLLLHGYGVRGSIWRPMQEALGDQFGRIVAPDMDAASVDELVTLALGRVRRLALEEDGPVFVIGHSLGAVLAAIAAQEIGAPTVAGAVLIAPPFGERSSVPGPVLKFLLLRRLIPPALLRPRFFSRQTPKSVQRAVFASAVPEAPALRELSFQRSWFHTARFDEPLSVPTLVVASEADRIVPVAQSSAFAAAIAATLRVFPGADGIGHDDFFAAEEVVDRVAALIAGFAAGA